MQQGQDLRLAMFVPSSRHAAGSGAEIPPNLLVQISRTTSAIDAPLVRAQWRTPKKRLKRPKPDELAVPDAPNKMWSMGFMADQFGHLGR
jgi:hypothetical protein